MLLVVRPGAPSSVLAPSSDRVIVFIAAWLGVNSPILTPVRGVVAVADDDSRPIYNCVLDAPDRIQKPEARARGVCSCITFILRWALRKARLAPMRLLSARNQTIRSSPLRRCAADSCICLEWQTLSFLPRKPSWATRLEP